MYFIMSCRSNNNHKVTIRRNIIDQESFLIENILPVPLKKLADCIPQKLVNNPIDSENGLKISYDKPLGSKHYHCNLTRPAVLRQFFGARHPSKDDLVFCYGTGSGSSTVGTHTDYAITREMTQEMHIIGHQIFLYLQQLITHGKIPHLHLEPFNHCTILLYFHKHSQSPHNMLGFHTDNVFSRSGVFCRSKNTQKEDTPTCILTLGDSRNLVFKKQFCFCQTGIQKNTKWVDGHKTKLRLIDNSLFVLHSHDERPYSLGGSLIRRWLHGIPRFHQRDKLSIALVYRKVTATTSTHNTSTDPIPVPPDIHPLSEDLMSQIHEKLKKLIKKSL